MPPNSPNPNNQNGWGPVWQMLQQMQNQLNTFLTTIPVKDNHGNTVALIGNLSTDPQTGAATGLGAVFGIASKKTGVWIQL